MMISLSLAKRVRLLRGRLCRPAHRIAKGAGISGLPTSRDS
jgi:hypothetical protein